MATWHEFESDAVELAGEVRRVLEAEVSHVLATIRQDGSPRVSGIEVAFRGEELTIGSMFGAVKARDLRRDGRFALHSHPGDSGDAKLSGIAVAMDPDEGPARDHDLFRFDLLQAVFVRVGDDHEHLLIRTWQPGQPVRAVRRY